MEQNMSISPALGFAMQQYYEYLLVVYPAEDVFKKIMDEKEFFSGYYKVSIAKKTLPHLTAVNFIAKEPMEETLIKQMHKIISNNYSFNVMLNNFSGFPSSKTIYARVQNHEPFKQLVSSLKIIDEYVRANGFPRVIFINHPHMTIARRLQKDVYDKAIMDYSQKTFNASFAVDELILLKRQNQYDKCRQVALFKLAPTFKA